MPKAGELTYVQKIGDAGVAFALNKPFSDPMCGDYMIAIGTLRNLLPAPPGRMLDLGCGTGWTSCMFAKMGYDVVGQDIAPDMISCANHNKAREQLSNVKFVVSDYESMPYQNEFDCAMFFDSLHHAEDEYLALEMVYRALKPGGVLVTREPGDGHSKNELTIHAMEEYGVTEKDMPPRKIVSMAKEIGFSKHNVFPFPDYIVKRFYREHENRDRPAGFLARCAYQFHDWMFAIRRLKAVHKMNLAKHSVGGIVCLVK